MNIDFVTTTINCPELLEETYQSYKDNINDLNLKDCRLILNIDPIPNNQNIDKILKVCSKYFKNVVHRVSKECNFTKGNLWCLSQVETDYFFYLQANKCIKREISFKHMKTLFDNKIVSVALSPIVKSGILDYLNWHPNLWKTSWIKNTYLKYASNDLSSEYQLRELGLLDGVKTVCYLKHTDNKYFLNHIGKKYKLTNNYFFGNLANNEEISTILKGENWHEKIYNIYKNKKVDKNVWDIFSRKVFGDPAKVKMWHYRWTGRFGYGSLNSKEYMTRFIRKNYSP